MSIIHNAEKSTITLHTDNTSYQIKIGPFGLLQHTYYGPHMEEDAEYCVMYRDRGFTLTPYDAERKRWLSAELMPLEYPCEAAGDFRAPALSIRRKDGVLIGDMRYESHRIEKGKYSLEGLPAVRRCAALLGHVARTGVAPAANRFYEDALQKCKQLRWQGGATA